MISWYYLVMKWLDHPSSSRSSLGPERWSEEVLQSVLVFYVSAHRAKQHSFVDNRDWHSQKLPISKFTKLSSHIGLLCKVY